MSNVVSLPDRPKFGLEARLHLKGRLRRHDAHLAPHRPNGHQCGRDGDHARQQLLVAIQPELKAAGGAGRLHDDATVRHVAGVIEPRRGNDCDDRHRDTGHKNPNAGAFAHSALVRQVEHLAQVMLNGARLSPALGGGGLGAPDNGGDLPWIAVTEPRPDHDGRDAPAFGKRPQLLKDQGLKLRACLFLFRHHLSRPTASWHVPWGCSTIPVLAVEGP